TGALAARSHTRAVSPLLSETTSRSRPSGVIPNPTGRTESLRLVNSSSAGAPVTRSHNRTVPTLAGLSDAQESAGRGFPAALKIAMWRVPACSWVSVRRRRHLADGRRGRVPWSGVAGGATGRHGGQVGCGAALPVIFWRSPGEGRWVTRGGVVLTVN